jgi:hypothetical protein
MNVRSAVAKTWKNIGFMSDPINELFGSNNDPNKNPVFTGLYLRDIFE